MNKSKLHTIISVIFCGLRVIGQPQYTIYNLNILYARRRKLNQK